VFFAYKLGSFKGQRKHFAGCDECVLEGPFTARKVPFTYPLLGLLALYFLSGVTLDLAGEADTCLLGCCAAGASPGQRG